MSDEQYEYEEEAIRYEQMREDELTCQYPETDLLDIPMWELETQGDNS